MSAGPRYPLVFDERRDYPPDYAGPVHLWDIDKTYLSTHFSSTRGLLRIPVEFAIDKRAIPGMPEVLRGLRRGAGAGFACAPIYFVSASPPQLRPVLERKMLLDGVEHDGTVLKDWLRVLRGWTVWRLREQIGFKLCALLTARRSRPRAVEYLYGDDTEADALAYTLYAELLAGALRGAAIDAALTRAGVAALDVACVRRLVDEQPAAAGRVAGIFIHLEHGRLEPLRAFAQVSATRDAVQLALAALTAGQLGPAAVTAVGEAVVRARPDFDLEGSVADALQRGLVSEAALVGVRWPARA